MNSPAPRAPTPSQARVAAGLKRRYAAERRFRVYGRVAVFVGLAFVVLLFGTIISKGYKAFVQAYLRVNVEFSAELVDPAGTRKPEDLAQADYGALVKAAMRAALPAVQGRVPQRRLYGLVSESAARELESRVVAHPEIVGSRATLWVLANDRVDQVLKGNISAATPEDERGVSDEELGYIRALEGQGVLALRFNRGFFVNGDSRHPEEAGVWGAVVGSFFTLVVTLLLSFPIGVAAAVYLEEFAKRNRLTDFIEVNVNNLAAVPSIVFGLLGLAIFIQWFGLPRSAPLIGGLVLTLMTLPTVIIASRSALKAVPPSIREAALGMGASQVQTIVHHVLPLAMPGMLTGAIIGMARALGESAPLLMIGMVAFVVDIPAGFTDPATALPVQIYLWSTSPERAFVERTSGAIIVLLGFLLVMNGTAVILRNRFERRW